TAPLPQEHWPAVLQDAEHVGAVYALDEMVLDVPRLQQALAEPHGTWIRKIEAEPQIAPRGDAIAIAVAGSDGRSRDIEAGHLIATAGSGNEALLAQLGQPHAWAQRRALRMAMIAD